MSENPERPRLTRRELREMERARSQEQQEPERIDPAPTPPEAQPGSEDPPPQRPRMTRRQLREAAAREEAEKEAANREAAQREAAVREAAERETAAQKRAAAEPEQGGQAKSAPEPEPKPLPTRVSSLPQRPQPRPSREAEGPAAPVDQPDHQRTERQRARDAAPIELEDEDSASLEKAGPLEDPVQSLALRRPRPKPARLEEEAAPAETPNVRPPEGTSAIRRVEETGELSPIISTSPGAGSWTPGGPAQPQRESADSQEPEDPLVTTGKQVPFRAPAWGARTLAAEQAAAAPQQEAARQGDLHPGDSQQGHPPAQPRAAAPPAPSAGGSATPGSGMRTSATMWPTSGQFSTGGFAATNFEDDLDDDEDEEYEPMFTWLRVLVLLVVAFTLGVLVWLIVGKEDPPSGAAALDLVTDMKNRLGV